MAPASGEWHILENYLIVEALRGLEVGVAWLGIDVLEAPLEAHDVDGIIDALEQIKQTKPSRGMSDREAVTLLNIATGKADALLKSIHHALPRTSQ